MEENTRLLMENIILKVENLIHKNTILEMKIKQHIDKYKSFIKSI